MKTAPSTLFEVKLDEHCVVLPMGYLLYTRVQDRVIVKSGYKFNIKKLDYVNYCMNVIHLEYVVRQNITQKVLS